MGISLKSNNEIGFRLKVAYSCRIALAATSVVGSRKLPIRSARFSPGNAAYSCSFGYAEENSGLDVLGREHFPHASAELSLRWVAIGTVEPKSKRD